jgi:hypothetical protein
MTFAVGQRVVLNTPDNLVFHGAGATIVELTPWGAHVATAAGAAGRFRALFAEMSPALADFPQDPATSAGPKSRGVRGTASARDMGYSGEVCVHCQGVRTRRSGSCLVCEECGATGGCG